MAKIEIKMDLNTDLETGVKEQLNISSNIQSLNSVSESTSSPEDISYGVLSNSGRVQVIDTNGEINKMIKDGRLPSSNVPIQVYVNNSLVQSYISSDSLYDENEKILSINMDNDLTNWEKIKFLGYTYELKSQSAYQMLVKVLESANYSASDIEEMVSDVSEYLKAIKIEYPHLEEDTLRATIDKICSIAQINCYMDKDNKIRFSTGRPIINNFNSLNPIRIPKSAMRSNIGTDTFIKNKFTAVDIQEQKVTDTHSDDTIIISKTLSVSPSIQNSQDTNFPFGSTGGMTNSVLKASWYATVAVKNYYQSGSFIFLEDEFSDIDPNEKKMRCTLNYTKKEGTCHAIANKSTPREFTEFSYEIDDKLSSSASGLLQGGFIQFSYSPTGTGLPSATTIAEVPDDTDITIVNNGDGTWTVNYNILVRQDYALLEGQAKNSWDYIEYGARDSESKNRYYQQIGDSFVINIYGAERRITFETVSQSDYISSNSVVASVASNELLQDKTSVYGKKLSHEIKGNIKNDYKEGVNTANVTIICCDMFYKNGDLAKNWASGEMLDVGDIVFFTGDLYSDKLQRYWRITGREFNYEGEPTIKLSLQEIVNSEVLEPSFNLEMADWYTIRDISKSGNAEKFFKVGDTKTFSLSTGEEITIAIAGFNHDTLTKDGEKVGISFVTTHSLNKKYAMNTSLDNANWNESTIKNEVLPMILSQLPEQLNEVITPVHKDFMVAERLSASTISGGTESGIYSLWNIGVNELTGTSGGWSKYVDGVQYKIFENNYAEQIKGAPFYLRSAASFTNTAFVGNMLEFDGEVASVSPTKESGIRFGFCI